MQKLLFKIILTLVLCAPFSAQAEENVAVQVSDGPIIIPLNSAETEDSDNAKPVKLIHNPNNKLPTAEAYERYRKSEEYSRISKQALEELQVNIFDKAVEIGDCDIIEEYLRSGKKNIYSDVPSPYDDGFTQPLIVLLTAFPQCMARVLPDDIDINQKFEDDTLLIYAVYNQNTETAELLLNKGADINILNRNHMTPLFIAVSQDDVNMVELLLKHNADTTIRNNNGKTAFDVCKQMPTMEVCKLAPNDAAKANQDNAAPAAD